jgi:Cu+-exporting ATPase
MAKQRDPVCGMMVETASATGPLTFRHQTYYFCSTECLAQFEADPERYAGEIELDISRSAESERPIEEPPFTKTGPIAAPKFGSAGSGGLEHEPPPKKQK